MKPILLILALVIISADACQSQSLPSWSSDMQIKIYNGGGMVPESQTVIISESSAMYIHWRMPKTDTFYFKLSKIELDSLVKQINDTKFQTMTSGNSGGIAYDMPTTSVELTKDKKIHEVAVGATTEIKNGDSKAFYKLYIQILTLAQSKVKHAED